jgi:hypothetical protein
MPLGLESPRQWSGQSEFKALDKLRREYKEHRVKKPDRSESLILMYGSVVRSQEGSGEFEPMREAELVLVLDGHYSGKLPTAARAPLVPPFDVGS